MARPRHSHCGRPHTIDRYGPGQGNHYAPDTSSRLFELSEIDQVAGHALFTDVDPIFHSARHGGPVQNRLVQGDGTTIGRRHQVGRGKEDTAGRRGPERPFFRPEPIRGRHVEDRRDTPVVGC